MLKTPVAVHNTLPAPSVAYSAQAPVAFEAGVSPLMYQARVVLGVLRLRQADPQRRGHSRRRLAQDQSALHRENFRHNLRVVEEVEAVAAEAGATPAQIALAWLLAQQATTSARSPVPDASPASRRTPPTAPNSAGQLDRLDNLTPAAGDRHDEANMASVDR